MTVAAPVRELRPTSRTGRCSVPVNRPVSQRMTPARTMPINTAAAAMSAGLPSVVFSPPVSSAKVLGR